MAVAIVALPLVIAIVVAIGSLWWRLRRGDQIESTSWGKQFFGRRRD